MREKHLLNVSIVTPQGSTFSGKATYVNAWNRIGSFRVLYNHAPFITYLVENEIELGAEGTAPKRFAVRSGILEVKDNDVKIAVEHAKAL